MACFANVPCITLPGTNTPVTSVGDTGAWNTNYADPTNTIGSGSTPGINAAAWGTFVNDVGSSVSGVIKTVEGPQITQLGNGMVMLPSGQVVSTMPNFLQSGQGMVLLLGGVAVLVVLFVILKK